MKTAIFALSLCLATPAIAQTPFPLGNWTGVGIQDGQTWNMTLDVVPGGARVDYPDFPCGGLWVFFDSTTPTLKGTEWLTYGKDMCLDGLGITMAASTGGGLSIRWYDDAGGEIARAELQGKIASTGKKSRAGQSN